MGGAAVGGAGGPGQTIEDAGEAILIGEAVEDSPVVGDAVEEVAAAQEPNNTTDPWGGAALPQMAAQAGGGEVADAPVADPWDVSPPAGGLLEDAVRLKQEHKAAMEAAREAGRTAGEAARDAAEAVEETIEDVGHTVEDWVEEVPFVGDSLGDAVGDAQDALKDLGDVAYEAAYTETMWREVYENAVPLGRKLEEVRKDLAEGFEAGMGEVVDELEDAVEDIPYVGDALEDVVDDARDLIDDAF